MRPEAPQGPVVAILGAESTGKTELARSLAEAIARHGHACTLVGEFLREWCAREGRTPRPDEQAAIAREQTRRIAYAARSGWVVADTTSLMTAIYSDMLFDDASLYDDALRDLRGARSTLVTALDLPWVADGLQRDGPHVREPVDALLRAALHRGGVGYSVVHGGGTARLANALRALGFDDAPSNAAPGRPADAAAGGGAVRVGADARLLLGCDQCSDAACEHRLFTDLVRNC